MRQSIIHVALVVGDYDEAIAFYCGGTLHFTLVEDTCQPEQDKRWVVVAPPGSAGTTLLLARASTPEQAEFVGNQAGGRVFLFLATDDFWRDYHAMRRAGVMRRDPALLERRLKGGPMAEPRPLQRLLVLGTSAGFIGLLVIPALDFRYKWSTVPFGAVLLGDVLFALGFGFIARVYRENTFSSATIGVVEGQRVISTGPYAIVRHPMYASALLYLIGTPLALGSYWGLLAFGFMIPFLIWRLVDEERMLVRELPGYGAYRERVRHRLVPFLW